MKVFWVLAWNKYYASGGLGNVYSQHETHEEAEVVVNELKLISPRSGYYFDYVQIEDVSEMLGIKEQA